jgi:hypothetical protein
LSSVSGGDRRRTDRSFIKETTAYWNCTCRKGNAHTHLLFLEQQFQFVIPGDLPVRLPFPENDQTHRDSGSRKRQERTVQRKEDSNNKGKMKEDAEEESSRSSDSRDNAAGNADSADRNVSNGSQRGKESGDPSPLCSKEENEKVLLSTSSAKEEIPRRSHKKRQGQGGRHRGSVWILLGILLISAALCMTAYNLLEERRADAAIDQAASALDAYYEEQASTESGGSEDSEAPVDSEKEAEERKELEELLADRDMPTVMQQIKLPTYRTIAAD